MSGMAALAERAVPYLDKKMEEDYRSLLRYKADMKAQHISYFEAQYLTCARSSLAFPQTAFRQMQRLFTRSRRSNTGLLSIRM